MKITNDSSRHENGVRIVTQTITFNLSDDIFNLSELQNRLGRTVKSIEESLAAESNDSVVRELENLNKDKIRILEEIRIQQANVDGYTT